MSEYVVELKNITKRFPGVVALKNMSIGIRPGEKMHEALLTEEEAELASLKGDYMVVSRQKPMPGRLKAPYRSELAERMSEDQVLHLIESVFRGGVE